MQQPTAWFGRTFVFQYTNERMATVIERLRGTPARLEEKLARITLERQKQTPPSQGWTIKEQAGHLLKLEELWLGRTHDIVNGVDRLRDMDMQNRATSEADFNNWLSEEILASFRLAREEWTDMLTQMPPDQLDRTAIHPRLNIPMRLIDLGYFVAEHDDHHLATISWLETQV